MRVDQWWFKLPLRIKSIFSRRRVESELDEELQFHIDHKIAEGIASGLSPDEARRSALRATGGLEQRPAPGTLSETRELVRAAEDKRGA